MNAFKNDPNRKNPKCRGNIAQDERTYYQACNHPKCKACFSCDGDRNKIYKRPLREGETENTGREMGE